MFGKGNFDGQFRTRPTVSIRGATKSETREDLIRRAQEERSNREVSCWFRCIKVCTIFRICHGSGQYFLEIGTNSMCGGHNFVFYF